MSNESAVKTSQLTNAVKQMSDYLKGKIDDNTTQLNDITNGIGGRNLVKNSKMTNTTTINNTETNTGYIKDIKCYVTNDLKVGDYLTMSCLFGYKDLSIASGHESDASIDIQGCGDVTMWNKEKFTTVKVPLNDLELNNAEFKEYYLKSSFKLDENHLKNSFWLLNLKTNHIGGSFYIKELKIEKGNISTGWTLSPEDIDEQLNELSIIKNYHPKLKGKSLYIGGDSIAFGAGSGGKSYGEIIAKNNGMVLTKNAVMGSTITVRDGRTDSILEKLQSTTGSFDYMILEGGINDMFRKKTIGTLSNDFIGGTFDTSTLIGATEKLCETLVTNFPTAKKLFVLVHRDIRFWGDGYEGTKQIDYWNAIKSVLEKWSIKYIDLSQQCALASYGNSYWEKMFHEPEGTHPTLEAYSKFYVPLIQSELLTL